MDLEERRAQLAWLADIVRKDSNIALEHQQEIVDALNDIFDIRNDHYDRIRIMRFNGVWGCFHFSFRYFNNRMFAGYYRIPPPGNDYGPDVDFRTALENWIPDYSVLLYSRMDSDISKYVLQSDGFFGVLGIAVCLACGQGDDLNRSTFTGQDLKNSPVFRETIASMIETGQMPQRFVI